ncbi:hypothetical protein FHS35_000663 [Streptomyces umbrinus]|nr:hypothetical protein [Streptomyces umbrinus]
MCITEFFAELGTDWVHDGSTRHRWVASVLEMMLAEPHSGPARPPESFCRFIDCLMSPADALNEGPDRPKALRLVSQVLVREGFEPFYTDDGHCYLRHLGTDTASALTANPHRPSPSKRCDAVPTSLRTSQSAVRTSSSTTCSFRCSGGLDSTGSPQLAARMALEYGKDMWLRFTLPTRHLLYFGIQVKRGKLDAAGILPTAGQEIRRDSRQSQGAGGWTRVIAEQEPVPNRCQKRQRRATLATPCWLWAHGGGRQWT